MEWTACRYLRAQTKIVSIPKNRSTVHRSANCLAGGKIQRFFINVRNVQQFYPGFTITKQGLFSLFHIVFHYFDENYTSTLSKSGQKKVLMINYF